MKSVTLLFALLMMIELKSTSAFNFYESCVARQEIFFSTSIYSDGTPANEVTSVSTGEELYVYFYDELYTFGTYEVVFKVYYWDNISRSYEYDNEFHVAIRPDWTWCYQSLVFYTPGKFKIKAEYDGYTRATAYIDVFGAYL